MITDVQARHTEPREQVPDQFWLHRRGAIAAVAWNTERMLDRRWCDRNVRVRPSLTLGRTNA
ncbi:MAG TPA: hypothetical protein VII98_15535 [Solirubrobacteraceae bacterium]